MAEVAEVLQSLFEGCAANVGPLIGVDFEVGTCEVVSDATPPEGELAVMPMLVAMDEREIGALELASPIDDLVPVGRRMLGDDNPDEKREHSADDLDAVGEILNLMSGAVDGTVREHINQGLRSRPLSWWQTADPGDNAFSDGEMLLGKAQLGLPGGSPIQVYIRLPASLFESGASVQSTKKAGRVLFLSVPDDVAEPLAAVFKGARMEIDQTPPDDPDIGEARAVADAIVVAGEADSVFPLCRELRLSNETWRTPVLVCTPEARRSFVTGAIQSGASHVLIVPTSDTEVLRVLSLARPPEA